MAKKAWELWLDLEKESQKKILSISGGLNIGTKNSHIIKDCMECIKINNMPHKILSAKELMQKYP